MERLTKHVKNKKNDYACIQECEKGCVYGWLKNDAGCRCKKFGELLVRLCQIEDILGDTYDLDRLRELVEADKDGRCVVMPCEVCDTVYILNKVFDGKEIKNTIEKRIVDKFTINRLKNTFYEISKPFVLHFNLCDFGKTVFLNREAAEVALAKEGQNNADQKLYDENRRL